MLYEIENVADQTRMLVPEVDRRLRRWMFVAGTRYLANVPLDKRRAERQ